MNEMWKKEQNALKAVDYTNDIVLTNNSQKSQKKVSFISYFD